jgi:pimeloyl-ACP methyl ester carboxylesterase
MTPVGIQYLNGGADKGPTLVFVHGLEDGWQSWQPVAAQLADGPPAVALDLPWRSGNNYQWRRLGTPASWLARALSQLPASDLIVVAHSFGATATLEVLADSARPVRAALLIAPIYRAEKMPLTWTTFDAARREFDDIIAEGIRSRLGDRHLTLDAGTLRAMASKLADRIGPVAFTVLFNEFAACREVRLAEATAHCEILGGPTDPCVTNGGAAALASAIPFARLIIDDRFNHFCHVNCPAVVAARVQDLIDHVKSGIRLSAAVRD